MWRRLKLIEFPMDYKDKPDKSIPGKLHAESPGILAWLVRGCLAWQENGHLAEPDTVREAVQDYRDQMDPLKEFLEARCIEGSDLTTPASDLYNAYTTWADDGNASKKERLTKRGFGLALGEKGFRNGKGGRGVRLWRGPCLRSLD